MTMNKAYKLFWLQGLDAHTKTSRVSFWKTFLANIIITFILSMLSFGILGMAYASIIYIPAKAMLARRLRDVGMSQCTAESLVGLDIVFDMCYLVIMIPLVTFSIILQNHLLALVTGLILIYKLLLLIFCMMSSFKK